MPAAVFAAGIAAVVFIVFFFKCPIKAATGFPCPGCGMTRACVTAFYDIKGAFFMHPLFPVAMAAGAAFVIPRSREYMKCHAERFTNVCVFLLIAVYIWRMLTVYPDAPMEYNENNFIGYVIGCVKAISERFV
ncbi:MAG: DUF2752 domain-containing protein [Oscillospiraceae bacterium]|nr:DUF2752 domain-containing protein [Oscillospiraceae bacterium]